MSRFYEMQLRVKKHKPRQADKIMDAAREEWSFTDETIEDDGLYASGQGFLYGGEMDSEFAARLARAVLEANDGPCDVEVGCVYLEDLPCETYCFRGIDKNGVLIK